MGWFLERLDSNLGFVTFELKKISGRHDNYGFMHLPIEIEIDEGSEGVIYKGEMIFFGIVLFFLCSFVIIFTG